MATTPKTGRTAPLGSVDPDVKVPRAVADAAARANAAFAPPAPAATTPPAAEPPADPAPAPVVSTPAPASPPSATVTVVSDQSWEHKYNSMRGRFERSDTQNRQLVERVSGLESTIAALQVTAPAAPAELRAASLLTPKEISDYGEDFLDVVKRQAAEVVSPEVAGLKKQVTDLTKRLDGVGASVQQDARSRMHTDLNTQLPNWTEINENEKFLNWLALPDTYSGAIRHTLLSAAYSANNAPRVLAFFKGFLAEEAAVTPREPAPDLIPPNQAVDKIPLETLAAPGRAKTAAADAPAEKPRFTRAQVTKFYTDVASGKYAGRDADRNRLDKQIHEAGRDGRIL